MHVWLVDGSLIRTHCYETYTNVANKIYAILHLLIIKYNYNIVSVATRWDSLKNITPKHSLFAIFRIQYKEISKYGEGKSL